MLKTSNKIPEYLNMSSCSRIQAQSQKEKQDRKQTETPYAWKINAKNLLPFMYKGKRKQGRIQEKDCMQLIIQAQQQ